MVGDLGGLHPLIRALNELALREDIAHLLAKGDEGGFAEGWPRYWVPGEETIYARIIAFYDGRERIIWCAGGSRWDWLRN